MKTTIKDIAERAGVSVSAVSLALNNRGGVSEETRQLILNIAHEMNYLRSRDVEETRKKKKGTLQFVKLVKHGHILNESHKIFIADYLEGIAHTARLLRYDLQMKSVSAIDIQEIQSKPAAEPLSGTIILGTELQDEDFTAFRDFGSPLLFLDTWHDFHQFDFVDMNNSDAVYRIMTHLAGNGHREIGFVTGSIESRNLNLRERAYREMLEYLGLPFRKEFLYKVDTTFEGAREDMAKLLGETSQLPTALFIANDTMAYGCMRALKDAGYRIPEDISVTGFDDLPPSELTDPPLTTVRVSKHQMGATAVELLVRRIEREPRMAPMKVLVGSELIIRDSVKKLD